MTKVSDHYSNSSDRFHYLYDDVIYSLWKYLNGRRLVRKAVLSFEDITPAKLNLGSGAMAFLTTLQQLDLELADVVFHKDIYLQYQGKTGYREIAKLKPGSKIALAYKNILKNDFSFQDLVDAVLLFNKSGVTEFFEFNNELPKKTQDKLNEFIDWYIDEFQKDNLDKENKNYLRFARQKEEMMMLLSSKERKYGNQFILKTSDFLYFVGKEYLFMHTLIAMEKSGYFTVQQIWVEDMDLPPEEQSDDYKIKLVLSDQYYRETNPRALKQEVIFNSESSLLYFNNEQIEISKTRNSDPHYLLSIIFRDKAKIWDYYEIWTDPYLNSGTNKYEPKTDWRRIYNAARSVNDKVAKVTKIPNFLTFNKRELSITKEYLE